MGNSRRFGFGCIQGGLLLIKKSVCFLSPSCFGFLGIDTFFVLFERGASFGLLFCEGGLLGCRLGLHYYVFLMFCFP